MVSEQYQAQWQAWHDRRVEQLNRPYGWLSLISQDWLTPGTARGVEHVPGQWLLENGEVYYLPDPVTDESHPLTVDGKEARERVHIPLGYNPNCGFGSAVDIFYGELGIELIARTDDRNERIVAVRVRDPQEARRRHIDDIPTYPLDGKWIVPARFREDSQELFPATTVENGVYETIYHFGELDAQIEGQQFTFDISGKKRKEGYEAIVHLRDATNGIETYGAGRFVKYDLDELKTTTTLDLNRLVTFPCALTNYVTCPLPPLRNRVPFAITAGEKLPSVHVEERIQTFHAQ